MLVCISIYSSEVLSAMTESTKTDEQILKQLINKMVWVEGGTFMMGSNSKLARKRETPIHEVSLDGFYINKTEVTQGEFEAIMGWNNSYFYCETCPVNNISWSNAQVFIQKLNKETGKEFELPTEAQWEYAAKGGVKSKGYTYSGANNISEVAWYKNNSKNKSHPVGGKLPNELGLYDMTGNLWEFCLDDMSRNAYSLTDSHNPIYKLTDDINKKRMIVIRGGGYEFSAEESKVFKRDGATNNVRMPDIGFRLVMRKQ